MGPAERPDPEQERQSVEDLMDKFIADSFPASDPPTWDCLFDRLNRPDDPGKSE
jgi:hypothetical protein